VGASSAKRAPSVTGSRRGRYIRRRSFFVVGSSPDESETSMMDICHFLDALLRNHNLDPNLAAARVGFSIFFPFSSIRWISSIRWSKEKKWKN
jgi:hypothetical protein